MRLNLNATKLVFFALWCCVARIVTLGLALTRSMDQPFVFMTFTITKFTRWTLQAVCGSCFGAILGLATCNALGTLIAVPSLWTCSITVRW